MRFVTRLRCARAVCYCMTVTVHVLRSLHEEKMDDELTPSLRQEGVKYAAESLDFCGDQPCDFSQAKYKSACTLDSER